MQRRSQARLNQALHRCQTIPLDEGTTHIAGRIRRSSGINYVVDAFVAATAALATTLPNVVIAMSDETGIQQLVHAAESLHPRLVHNEIRTHRT